MGAYILIPVKSQFIVPKLQDCHVLPEVSHVHADQQEIIILIFKFGDQDCSDDIADIPRDMREAATKRTKVLLSYLSTRFMRIPERENKQKRPRQNIFPFTGSGTF
jgi:hypothetical protein